MRVSREGNGKHKGEEERREVTIESDIEWGLVKEGNGKHKGEEERREVTIERVWRIKI